LARQVTRRRRSRRQFKLARIRLGCVPCEQPWISNYINAKKKGFGFSICEGHLIIGDSEAILRTAIVALAESRPVNIILNLAEVTKIDDNGLATLVFCHSRIVRSGGALKLLNLPPHVSLMVLTKLDTLFEVFTDEQDAVNSFFPDRAVRHYDILEWLQEQEKRPARDLPK
jgi:anti-sigma B factor antagonist